MFDVLRIPLACHRKGQRTGLIATGWRKPKRVLPTSVNEGRGPANWVLYRGKNIPAGAIQVGREKSWTLYICKASYEVCSYSVCYAGVMRYAVLVRLEGHETRGDVGCHVRTTCKKY